MAVGSDPVLIAGSISGSGYRTEISCLSSPEWIAILMRSPARIAGAILPAFDIAHSAQDFAINDASVASIDRDPDQIAPAATRLDSIDATVRAHLAQIVETACMENVGDLVRLELARPLLVFAFDLGVDDTVVHIVTSGQAENQIALSKAGIDTGSLRRCAEGGREEKR